MHSKTSRLLFVGCFVLAALMKVSVAIAGTIFHDDFNGSLNSAWSIVRPNASFYTLQSTGLVLRCNYGDIWTYRTDAQNLFLISNSAPADFTLTAKLRWLVPPVASYAQIDLLAYDDDNNHVRLCHGMLSGVLRIDNAGEANGTYSGHGLTDVNFGTDWFWLQMRKEGTTYSAWYSRDGVTFSQASSPFTYGDGTPAKLGLVAMVDPTQSAQVVVDWFKVEDTAAPAFPFGLDWWTVDGGGGTDSVGPYALSSTIGQPDAGAPMSVGPFALTGGFWALPVAVQTSGAPTLTIARGAPGFASISWTPATPGFVLQESLSLLPAQWTNSPSGVTNPVAVPAALPAKFYRLFKP